MIGFIKTTAIFLSKALKERVTQKDTGHPFICLADFHRDRPCGTTTGSYQGIEARW